MAEIALNSPANSSEMKKATTQSPVIIFASSEDARRAAGYLWILPDAQTRWLWPGLATQVARAHGLVPVFVVATAQDAAYYWKALGPKPFGTIVVADDIYDAALSPPADPIPLFAEAAFYEKENGVSLMRAIVQGDRHLGRGYMTGAEGFTSSAMSERATLAGTINACLTSIRFWNRLAAAFPPRLALCYCGGHGIFQKPLALLCRSSDVSLRVLSSGRFGNAFYWAYDEYASAPGFADFYSAFAVPDAAAVEAVRERITPHSSAGADAIAALHASHQWGNITRYAAGTAARRLYGLLRGYKKATRGYRLSGLIAERARARHHLDFVARTALRSLDGLGSRRIVYLPLQVEPEATTTTWGEYASDQLALARECALSLPSDAVLVIKEHPWQLGRRSRRFYRQLAALPNAAIVHPMYSSLDIIRRSSAVVTINGSAAHEAAALGIAAMHFHAASTLNVLEHVTLLESLRDLEKIRDTLRPADPSIVARRRHEGARYVLALDAFCFEIGGGSVTLRKTEPGEAELQLIAAELDKTLPVNLSSQLEKRKAGAR